MSTSDAAQDTARQVRRPASHTRKPRPADTRTVVRVLARRLHFLAGIFVAPFLVVLCLTGLLYVFTPQIHDSLYHSMLYVQNADGRPHPMSHQVEAALTAHPEATVRAVMPPPAPDRTTRVLLSVPDLDDSGEPGATRTVFVDPYTGYLNGELTTVANQLPANTWLRDLHSNLHLGDAGRLYSELAASWLPFIALGGVAVWLLQPGRRRRWGELLRPSTRSKAERLRLLGVHGPVGLWLAVGLLLLGLSGLTMSQFAGGRTQQAVDPLDARAPALTGAPVDVPANADRIGIDEALAVAAAEGLGGELVVTLPAAESRPYTAAERSVGLPLRHDSIAIHPSSGKVIERIGWSDYPLGAKLATIGVEFHTGRLFGLANQIIVALLALGVIALAWLGYRMWWTRNPYKDPWASAPPPAWRQLPRTVLAGVVVTAAVLGWLLPVFGVSLVGFVVVDAVINAIRRRRQSLRTRAALTAGTVSAGATALVRRLRRRPATVAAGSAALVASVVLVLSVLWPFGAREIGEALPAPAPTRPAVPPETREPTPTESVTGPTPTPERTRPGSEPAADWSPPVTRPNRDPGAPGPAGTPTPTATEQPPTSAPSPSPTAPEPPPSPSPTSPSPTQPPSPPPPDSPTPCTVRIADLCVIVDLPW
ncbi:PepSY domain-containing protein [Actinopolymorpha sp. B17G11]|uniref:PepSY-associated TM helix domain-containing protein n=1 Tax=Actinopolymorpha sp. B17G11 TaxID=3160861 RepID=UPI0032E3EE3C